MPDRIPSDDLYARLGVPVDADAAAIERAWRALLKRHHPDIAGLDSLEAAKRINVAHDWLSQPDRRARYDAARHGRTGATGRRRGPTSGGRPGARGKGAASPAPPDDALEERFGAAAPGVRILLAQVAAISPDDLDRLAVAEPRTPTIDLEPFVPAELWARVDRLERLIATGMPAVARGHGPAIGAARAFARALILEPFLRLHMRDPELLLDDLRHAWEVAVGQPRYGPNTPAVSALLRRIERMTPAEGHSLAAGWDRSGVTQDPWPAGIGPDEYEALSISAALARRDAAAAVPATIGSPSEAGVVREAAARSAHVVALRPIFRRDEFARLQGVWSAIAGPDLRDARPAATVRRA